MVDVVIAPDMWEGDEKGFISTWFFRDGECVAEGAVLADVMSEKVTFELRAPAAGMLSVLVAAEEPIAKGQVVARIS